MSALIVDRHALTASADRFNRAWGSYGWTPVMEGARASRLEEAVPWGSVTARAAEPAWLKGPVDEVLEPRNFDRLHFAFLPLDDRLGLCVWGAIGGRERGEGEWRVLTHTLLFDRAAFRAMAGYPLGLFRPDRNPAGWFRRMVEEADFAAPAPLEPIRLEPSREVEASFERARRRELMRLGRRLLELCAGDADRVTANVAAVLESLHRTSAVDGPRYTAVRTPEPGRAELLVRLSWLALPLEERAGVHFATEQRRTDRPAARLLVLSRDEWGHTAPPAADVLEGAALDSPADVSAGRRHWAEALVRGLADPDAAVGDAMRDHAEPGPAAGAARRRSASRAAARHFAQLSARAEIRGWRIVAGDDLRPAVEYADWAARRAADGPSLELAARLLDIERRRFAAGGRPRAHALGHAIAVAARAEAARAATGPAMPVDSARALLAPLRGWPIDAAGAIVRGIVRTLARGDLLDRQAAGIVRCMSVMGAEPLVERGQLARLLERERPAADALLADRSGAALLFRAASELARAGDERAAPLAEAAVLNLDAPGRAVRWLRDSLRLDDARDAEWAVRCLTLAEQRWPRRFPNAAITAHWLVPAIERGAAPEDAVNALARYLHRGACLDRMLERLRGDTLARFLRAARPPMDAVVAAFERRAGQGAGPDPLGTAIVAFCRAGRDDALALLRFALAAYPAAPHRPWWEDWLRTAPGEWLVHAGVLGAFEGALQNQMAGELASVLLRRALPHRSPGHVDADTAVAVLGLLDLEPRAAGRAETVDWIATRLEPSVAAAVLVALLEATPPLPLYLAVRRGLIRAGENGTLTIADFGAHADTVAAWSPAAREALAGSGTPDGSLLYLVGS